MTYPVTVVTTIDFSTGATFGFPFVLGDPKFGVLGVGTLAESASDYVDVSNQVMSISIRGGYNLLQDQFQAGQATIRINDPQGFYNPQNTASPYFGKLVPLRKIRVSGNYDGGSYYLFSGYIQAYNYSYPKDFVTGYVDIIAADAFRLLNLANITTVTGAAAGDTTGERINQILDEIAWPASLREIDTGDNTVQNDPANARQALSALKNVEQSEGVGAFYAQAEGDLVFLSRHNLQAKAGQTPIVFANNGTGISYWGLTFANDDKLIINEATFTPKGLTGQYYSDAASIAKYFPHSINFNDLVMQTEAQAYNGAVSYVTTRKDTTIRIDSLTLDLNTPDYAAGVLAALSMDYFTVITIITEAQAGTSITKTLQILGANHDITPNSWRTTFTTGEPIIDAFILNSDTWGVLGVNTLSY
ncbi:MAG: hypothetical protein ACR2IJ_02495 [Fluviibacter sp.]